MSPDSDQRRQCRLSFGDLLRYTKPREAKQAVNLKNNLWRQTESGGLRRAVSSRVFLVRGGALTDLVF